MASPWRREVRTAELTVSSAQAQKATSDTVAHLLMTVTGCAVAVPFSHPLHSSRAPLQTDTRAGVEEAAVSKTPLGKLRRGGERRLRRRSAVTEGTLLLLLVLGLVAAVVYVGPFHPTAVLHLHLQLPHMAAASEVQSAAVATRRELHGVGGDSSHSSHSTLSFDVCSGFATQRVALVSGERPGVFGTLPCAAGSWAQALQLLAACDSHARQALAACLPACLALPANTQHPTHVSCYVPPSVCPHKPTPLKCLQESSWLLS